MSSIFVCKATKYQILTKTILSFPHFWDSHFYLVRIHRHQKVWKPLHVVKPQSYSNWNQTCILKIKILGGLGTCLDPHRHNWNLDKCSHLWNHPTSTLSTWTAFKHTLYNLHAIVYDLFGPGIQVIFWYSDIKWCTREFHINLIPYGFDKSSTVSEADKLLVDKRCSFLGHVSRSAPIEQGHVSRHPNLNDTCSVKCWLIWDFAQKESNLKKFVVTEF